MSRDVLWEVHSLTYLICNCLLDKADNLGEDNFAFFLEEAESAARELAGIRRYARTLALFEGERS